MSVLPLSTVKTLWGVQTCCHVWTCSPTLNCCCLQPHKSNLNDSCLMGQCRKQTRCCDDITLSWWRYTEHLTTTTDQLFLLREDEEDDRKDGRKEEGGWKEEEEETIFSVGVFLNIPWWIPPLPRRRRGSWLLCHYSSQFLNVCFSVCEVTTMLVHITVWPLTSLRGATGAQHVSTLKSEQL